MQRLQNVLEDAGIKLNCVVSDVLGKSARAMLAALIAGERDPKVLAELALGRLRPKVGALEQALVGRFGEHHGRLCSKMLAHIDSLTATIEELTGEIQTQIAPFQHTCTRLSRAEGVLITCLFHGHGHPPYSMPSYSSFAVGGRVFTSLPRWRWPDGLLDKSRDGLRLVVRGAGCSCGFSPMGGPQREEVFRPQG